MGILRLRAIAREGYAPGWRLSVSTSLLLDLLTGKTGHQFTPLPRYGAQAQVANSLHHVNIMVRVSRSSTWFGNSSRTISQQRIHQVMTPTKSFSWNNPCDSRFPGYRPAASRFPSEEFMERLPIANHICKVEIKHLRLTRLPSEWNRDYSIYFMFASERTWCKLAHNSRQRGRTPPTCPSREGSAGCVPGVLLRLYSPQRTTSCKIATELFT